MKTKIFVTFVILFIVLFAYALIKPNMDGHRALLNERAALLILDGIQFAQREYYKKNSVVTGALSALSFSQVINSRLEDLGNGYVMNAKTIKAIEKDEFYFHTKIWINDDQQQFLFFLLPRNINNGFNCWVFLDFSTKNGVLVINGGSPRQIDHSIDIVSPVDFVTISSIDV